MLKFGDKVKVTEGFYKGIVGKVTDFDDMRDKYYLKQKHYVMPKFIKFLYGFHLTI